MKKGEQAPKYHLCVEQMFCHPWWENASLVDLGMEIEDKDDTKA